MIGSTLRLEICPVCAVPPDIPASSPVAPQSPQTKTVAVEERPTPEIGDNKLLIKVEYAAANPTDRKRTPRLFVFDEPPSWNAIWLDVKYVTHNGGFSGYVRRVAGLASKIPGQAATVAAGVYSAVMCTTHPKRLDMTDCPGKASGEQRTVVSGLQRVRGRWPLRSPIGSSAGIQSRFYGFAEQPRGAQNLGADVVFDVTEAMGAGGGKALVITRPNGGAAALRSNVSIQLNAPSFYVQRALRNIRDRLPSLRKRLDHIHLENSPQLLELGSLKPMNVNLWESGLGRAAEALLCLKVRAEKLVIEI
ncbi:hypothetical protein BJ322DRAFT_1188057 [Thelephora terrestris]|uniref:Uncharacterized protein n=1 Tax=Thelephora terrestris TaxID=56493 RepID=A0A9P6H4I4_9AGAM|nr:hypothetical protein BJ322DRAFT_1188057 [Thelephora terrestris]